MANFFQELFGLKPKRPHGQRANDHMEDGFLVVGETEIERTTVVPGQVVNRDLPPSYNNVQIHSSHNPYRHPEDYHSIPHSSTSHTDLTDSAPLPSYTQAQGMPSWRTDSERQHSWEQSGHSAGHSTHSNNMEYSSSTLSGVPFQLSPALESGLFERNQNLVTTLRRPNMRDFDYDFTLEIQVLTEYGLSEIDLDNIKISSMCRANKTRIDRQYSEEVMSKYIRQDSDVNLLSF